jgi:chemotaxis protein MotA
MFAIIGILIVIGAVVGGYLMEHGKLLVLMQPAELVIIGGAAAGTLLIANPLSTVIAIVKGILGVLKGSPHTKATYLETLKMLNELFMQARKQGMVKLEEDVEDPSKARSFRNIRNFSPIITPCTSSATPFACPSAEACPPSTSTR